MALRRVVRFRLQAGKPAHQLAYDNPLFSEWREDILRPSPQLIVAHSILMSHLILTSPLAL
jgi:hypothetical protein